MPIDMKKMIAEAAWRLLTEKKVRKLTVKDIVEECHITRQSFYYHFEDIPDLLRWVLEQGLERMMEESQAQGNDEESIRYFFLMAINAMPYVRKTMESNYGEEIERLLRQQIYRLFERAVEEKHLYRSCSQSELKPVSYTHLDVYKRQVSYIARRKILYAYFLMRDRLFRDFLAGDRSSLNVSSST